MPSTFPVTCHTDHVGIGSTFVAIKGDKQNGCIYIEQALQKGASIIVVEEQVELDFHVLDLIAKHNATLKRVFNARAALAELSAQAAGYPANALTIIGITGTKGKTTITYIIEHIFRSAGIKIARITGVSNSINGQEIPASLTTPQPDYLHQFFKLCLEHQVTHVVMEVAAQALSLHRVDTISFDGIIFTNIAREHFEFYRDLNEYFAAKCLIFNHAKPQSICLLNGDDERCSAYARNHSFTQYGFKDCVDIRAIDCAPNNHIEIVCEDIRITCPTLIGHYNASNILAAWSMARAYGISHELIQEALNTFPPIPGRMETYRLPNGASCIIDYAHNPSSYKALLNTLRPLTDHLIVIFGASGSRDKGKRPLMGRIAAHYADTVILTSDNPGMVDPYEIMADIEMGIESNNLHKIIREPDRAQAIKRAYALSQQTSFIVLLGKGRDEYQVIGTKKYDFSERAIVQQL